ncbi:MAG: DedA family protein [Lachnospiraceae bacterium]|nr:DedA family protein [Lachnospiraceae bacterium]
MERLFSLLRHFGLPAMLLLILLEYACFPVSSEIILPFCGALASNQNISFPLLVLLSGFAGLIGTSICYTIGYFGGTPLLTRLGKRFPSLHKGIEGSFQKFRRYGKLLVLFGRFIPLCRTYLGFAAGAMRQPLRIFLPFSFIGILCWNCLLLGLGFFLKENWSIVTSWYARYKNLLIPALLLLLLFIVTKNRTKELA